MKKPKRRQNRAGGGSGPRLAHAWSSLVGAVRFGPAGPGAPAAEAGSTRAGARARHERPSKPDQPDPLSDPSDLALERAVRITGPASALPGLGSGLGAYLERNRAELAPIAFAAAILGVAAWGHMLAPWSWPLVGLLGLSLTALWCRLERRPPLTLGYGIAVGVTATVVAGSGVRAGIERPAWLVLLVVVTALMGGPWWIVHWSRSRAQEPASPATPETPGGDGAAPGTQRVEVGGWWAMARAALAARKPDENTDIAERVQRIVDGWAPLAEAVGIKGAVLQAAEHDEHGFTLRLRLPAGLIPAKVADKLRELDGALRVRPGATRVEADRNRADLVLVRVNISDPLDPAKRWPGPSGKRAADPVTLGHYETARPIRVPLLNSHWMLGGASGSGKSVTQRAVLAELVTREDVVTLGIDVAKAGVQFAPYGSALDWLATEPDEAVRMLRALLAMQRARARWMAAEGLTEWPVSPEHPQVVVVVDEVSDLSTIPAVPELLEALAKVAREQGITLILATQRASADALGDSAVARAQMNVRLALRCRERGDGDLILGRGRAAEGWRPDRLTLPGSMLVLTDEETTPCPGRSYFMKPDEARQVAARAAESRPRLDAVSANAVAPYRLGDQGEATAALDGLVGLTTESLAPLRRSRVTAVDRVLALIAGVGADGMTAGEVVSGLEGSVSRTQVFAALKTLLETVRIAQREDGRYVPVAGDEGD